MASRAASGAIKSPNIWDHTDVYEIENHAVDPDGIIETTMRDLRPWQGATLLDLGCGTGFHLPRFAASAAQVVGLEPNHRLAAAARRRAASWPNVRVLDGAAQRVPLPDASVDVVQARWAYFFDQRCEPGLRELSRIVRRGGAAFLIDNDARPQASTFSRWFAEAHPEIDPAAGDRFFARYGFSTLRRTIRWDFERRADLEAVVRIEFDPARAARILDSHAGTTVDYAVVIRHRPF